MSDDPSIGLAADGSAARRVAFAYVDAMNLGDLKGILALFAPEAVIRHPTGDYRDPDEMRAFFEVGMRSKVELRVERSVAENSVCLIEFSARVPGDQEWGQRAANVFTVDANDRVCELDIYYRQPHRLPRSEGK